jgi:hypothetical protein
MRNGYLLRLSLRPLTTVLVCLAAGGGIAGCGEEAAVKKAAEQARTAAEGAEAKAEEAKTAAEEAKTAAESAESKAEEAKNAAEGQ